MKEFNLKTYAINKDFIKIAGRKRIRDRGINWQEHYHEKSQGLKKRFDKTIGKMSYMRWEGHDYTTNSDYFVVVGPAVTEDLKKMFFAGVKKMPDDPKAKVYAPSGKYFTTIVSAYQHAHDKWAVPYPENIPEYTLETLFNIKIPRHLKS